MPFGCLLLLLFILWLMGAPGVCLIVVALFGILFTVGDGNR